MLTADQIQAIKVMQGINRNIVFGGSLCLNAYGLLDREVGDLDVFVDKDNPFDVEKFRRAGDLDRDYDFTTEFNGEILDRIPLVINGVKVCIFKVPKYLLSAVSMDIDGLEIGVQNPCFAIAGKVLFSKHDPKHTVDLDAMRSKLLNLTLF